MKKLTKILALAMCLLMAVGMMASCGKGSDWAKVQEQGYFTCGVTVYEPMNYMDENGEWTGFDTEFAQAVCAELGLEAEFVQIDWNTKEAELDSRGIDCIWNGFTIDDDRRQKVDFSIPYLKNAQTVVVRADSGITSLADLAGRSVCAEMASAGANAIEASLADSEYIGVSLQSDCLTEVKARTCDAAVIDYVMANTMIGAGTSYSELVMLCDLDAEEYGIGFRKGSTAVAEVNAAIETLAADGTLAAIAARYGLDANLCV
ncbi:MAG: transporter substrate-binding domain-containing protein [Oscillospiraceae bacterium]|nr:transporter substrate-binding domain-containing protein [Oscillospiraceae bacterium]